MCISGLAIYGASTDANAVTYDENFDSKILPKGEDNSANSWQTIKGKYAGPYTGVDVSQGFDEKSNVSYSDDNLIRMQKNVIGTGVENEFLMYMNIEPQVSWEDILKLNTIKVTNSNKPISAPGWPSTGNKTSYFSPEPTSVCKTPVKFRYYAYENGKKTVLVEVTMYCSTPNVPKGGIGIGNPLLTGGDASKSFYATNNFDIAYGEVAEIDISSLYSKYEFCIQPVTVKSVADVKNDTIEIYEGSLNYDGGSCQYDDNTGVINWTLPTKDLGLLPYKIDANGNVTPSGVLRKLDSGKYTYYRQDAYRMSYKFYLDVQSVDFVSCESANSANDASAGYAVQTNKSPGNNEDTIKGGALSYSAEGQNRTAHFNSPYIKGMLYTIEFKKVIKDSDVTEYSNVPIDGIKFEITRVNRNNSTHSEAIEINKTNVSGKTEDGEDGTPGKVVFEKLPWGYYEIKEIAVSEDNVFVNNYIDFSGDNKLPKVIDAKDNVGEKYAAVGYVLQSSKLEEGHIYRFREGKVENDPYTAKIVIKKIIENVDQTPDKIKNSKYEFLIDSKKKDTVDEVTGEVTVTGKAVYLYPKKSDSELKVLKESTVLGNDEESSVYQLIVPKDGAEIKIDEIIPDELKKNVEFKNIEIEKNEKSSEHGDVTTADMSTVIEIMPENDLVITVTNEPVSRVYIRKMIDNYRSELAEDEFTINVDSVRGQEISTSVVLKHGETSKAIPIKGISTLKLKEIVPQEYQVSDNIRKTVSRENGDAFEWVNGNIDIPLGENITLTVYNTYGYKPYFHNYDSVMNEFNH